MKTIEVPPDLLLSHLLLSRRFPGSRTPDNLNSHGLRRMARLTLASRTMVREQP